MKKLKKKSKNATFFVRLCRSRISLYLLVFTALSVLIYYSIIRNRSWGFHSIFSPNEGNISGMKILLINDRTPTYQLVTYENYQFPLERNRAQTELFLRLKLKEECQSKKDTAVFDIGASFGEFAFYAAACGCQVYMFEIDRKKLFYIEKSIELNSFGSRIHLIKKAVSDSRKKPVDQAGSSGETIYLNEHEFPSLKSIYFLRIDVQGHELRVMRSMEKYFQSSSVGNLLFQFTPWQNEERFQKDTFNYLKEILHAKQFYALHPKQAILYGPLNDPELQTFYADHLQQHLQRDVFVRFDPEDLNLTARPYLFQSSF